MIDRHRFLGFVSRYNESMTTCALSSRSPRRFRPPGLGRACALAVLLCCAHSAVIGQSADAWDDFETDPPATRADAPLPERQRDVQSRLERLEARMAQLVALLSETEPDKADRLSEGLDFAGRERLRGRVAELVAALEEGRFGEADARQQALLAKLDSMLQMLTSPVSALDRLREARERLEAARRALRELSDEETRQLYFTARAAEQLEAAATDADAARRLDAEAEALAQMRQIEGMQRITRDQAQAALEQMRLGRSVEESTPGAAPLERAVEAMSKAADRLAEGSPPDAQAQQKQALRDLQSAMNEVDEALRQLRKEEKEEALDALEDRLRRMLDAERAARVSISSLVDQTAATWSQAQHGRAQEAAQSHDKARAECELALRIMRDEGTTVAAPALLEQAGADMALVAGALAKQDVTSLTAATLDDVIALLDALLAAIEKERDEMAENEPQGQEQPQGAQQQATPLLPRSAELKLLRFAQARINERTRSESERAIVPDMELFERLATRQEQLAEQARRLNEVGQ